MGKVTRNPSLKMSEGTRIIFQTVPPEFLKKKLEEKAAKPEDSQPHPMQSLADAHETRAVELISTRNEPDPMREASDLLEAALK